MELSEKIYVSFPGKNNKNQNSFVESKLKQLVILLKSTHTEILSHIFYLSVYSYLKT